MYSASLRAGSQNLHTDNAILDAGSRNFNSGGLILIQGSQILPSGSAFLIRYDKILYYGDAIFRMEDAFLLQNIIYLNKNATMTKRRSFNHNLIQITFNKLRS